MASSGFRGFAANLSKLFLEEKNFLKRLVRARKFGFDVVEISTQELYDFKPAEVTAVMKGEGLECALFNMPAGSTLGLAALPGHMAQFNRSVDTTLEYAVALSCDKVHCMAGLAPPQPNSGPWGASEHCYKKNLSFASRSLSSAGVTVHIEPINPKSMPNYYLSSFPQAADTIQSLLDDEGINELPENGSVKLLFDVFHCQIIHGDIVDNLRRYRDIIGHIQIAGVPGRLEPDSRQEINYPFIFDILRNELGYSGHIGLEYDPRAGTEAGLGWLQTYAE